MRRAVFILHSEISIPHSATGISALMRLLINGEEKDIAAATVAELVAQLGMKPDRVAVELNREIVPRDRWPSAPLRDGDKLEIVQFVGGGMALSLDELR